MKRAVLPVSRYKWVLGYCLLLGLLVVGLKYSAYETYRVKYNSMNRTLRDGDKLLIRKYGGEKISRESILIFRQGGGTYVKRSIALPGEVIELKNGKVWVDGVPAQDPVTVVGRSSAEGQVVSERQAGKQADAAPFTESSDFNIAIVEQYDTLWTMQNFGPFLVPEKGQTLPLTKNNLKVYGSLIERENRSGYLKYLERRGASSYTFKNDYYFMLGDNRPASTDSRIFGPITETQIIGQATMILFSYHHLLKADRFFKTIQ